MDNEREREEVRKLPRSVWFAIFFGGSFLPGSFGKISAALAGMILALYLLSLMRGGKRYVFAIVLPVMTCIVVRLASGNVYRWIVDVDARDEAVRRMYSMVNMVVHYFRRIGETVCGFRDAVSGFCQTWEIQCLEPIWGNIQFVLILLIMVVCVVAVFRREDAS